MSPSSDINPEVEALLRRAQAAGAPAGELAGWRERLVEPCGCEASAVAAVVGAVLGALIGRSWGRGAMAVGLGVFAAIAGRLLGLSAEEPVYRAGIAELEKRVRELEARGS